MNPKCFASASPILIGCLAMLLATPAAAAPAPSTATQPPGGKGPSATQPGAPPKPQGPTFERFKSLDGSVNTARSEFGPSFTRDGRLMVFNARRSGERYQNLYQAEYRDGRWTNVRPIRELNSRFNDETPSITPDGKFIFFSSDRDGSFELPKDSRGRIRVSYDLYWSQRTAAGWSRPLKVPGKVNTQHHERSPSFDVANQILYYSSWHFGDIRKARILRAELKNGNFVNVTSLPPEINKGFRETAPTVSLYRSGLFFSSQRPGGLGGWDIYFVSYEKGNYGKPVNLGPEINTASNEFFFHRIRNKLYFCSDRPGGRGRYDVLAFGIPDKQDLRFRVVDSETGKPIRAKLTLSGELPSGPPFETEHSTNDAGRASASIAAGARSLRVRAESPGYLPLAAKARGVKPEQVLELVRVQADGSFEVRAVNFDFNSAKIKRGSHGYLDSLAAYLKKSDYRYRIIGHTDLHGGRAENQRLSLRRARAVRDYLVKSGVPESRFEIEGAGMERPLVKRKGAPHDARNRRTEFRRIGPKA